MTTRTWNGTAADFFTAADWSPEGAPQPGDVAVIYSGTAAVTAASLQAMLIGLNGSTSSAPTLRLTDANIASTTKIAASSQAPVGYLPATIAVQGVVSNNGKITMIGDTSRFEVSFASDGTTAGGTLVNAGAIDAAASSPFFEDPSGTGTGVLQNEGMVSLWNPNNQFQSASIAVALTGGGTIQVNPHAVLGLNGAVGPNQLIDFTAGAGAGETLQISYPTQFQGTINGFSAGDQLVIGETPFTGYTYTSTGAETGTLSLFNGATAVANLKFQGNYQQSDFSVAGLGAGGSSLAVTTTAAPAQVINLTNADLALSTTDAGVLYTGPVAGLQRQYIWSSPDSVAISSTVPNAFLKGGAGDDALSVTGGTNVLDGGAGSNFLVGSADPSSRDTFFVDGRGGAVTWSTIVNFHPGDQATIFGFQAGTSTAPFTSSDGVAGYTGATIHSELNGAGTGINASMTFAGIDQATANTFSITSGTLAGGVNYLLIQYL